MTDELNRMVAEVADGRRGTQQRLCHYPITGVACRREGVDMTNCQKCKELAMLLLEARDALPAITMTQARLHDIDLRLADRIESALEPWRVS